MELDSVTITKSRFVLINGKIKGLLQEIQNEIISKRMDLVQKYKFKAIYIGNAKFRYLADWELIIGEYYGVPRSTDDRAREEGA